MHLLRLYHTIRHLRSRQIWYRMVRSGQRKRYKEIAPPEAAIQHALSDASQKLFAIEPFDKYEPEKEAFSILNLSASYPEGIDWNDKRQGLLWGYHLNYFGWLEDEGLSIDNRAATIKSYVEAKDTLRIGVAPYPTSLRSVAWIRFFVRYGASHGALVLLFQHLHRLYMFPEYELDGNHLWENGCALLAGGLYFNHKPFLEAGIGILTDVVDDQLTTDGGHIEGSPMYHSLLLLRLMMCIELWEKLSPSVDSDKLRWLKGKAEKMLGWIDHFTFSDCEWPMVNDSAYGVAPPTSVLMAYAKSLGLVPSPYQKGGGYRMYRGNWYELFLDIGNIEPKWQPGHSHADTLSFCLNVDGKALISDSGISNYDVNERRNWERGTAAHNTVNINGMSSSEVWKSFRIGRRAQVEIEEESVEKLSVSHDGYDFIGIKHRRSVTFATNKITIEDFLQGLYKQTALLHLYFHPNVNVEQVGNNSLVANKVRIVIDGAFNIAVERCEVANGFNRLVPTKRLTIIVGGYTKTIIERIEHNAD